ncbi:hypothetical protein [Streptomyces sp. NPDC001678]|uniref:hypothetical protein n=1 Tax=Streptomyces sp. NPDC001678 TaxID=3364599 RepID=UPI00367DC56F
MITHASPQKRDLRYDHRQQRFTLPISVHHLDGTVEAVNLVFDPDQMTLFSIQAENAIERRKKAVVTDRVARTE